MLWPRVAIWQPLLKNIGLPGSLHPSLYSSERCDMSLQWFNDQCRLLPSGRDCFWNHVRASRSLLVQHVNAPQASQPKRVSICEAVNNYFFPLESLWVSTDGFTSNRKTKHEMVKPTYVWSSLQMSVNRGSITVLTTFGALRVAQWRQKSWETCLL